MASMDTIWLDNRLYVLHSFLQMNKPYLLVFITIVFICFLFFPLHRSSWTTFVKFRALKFSLKTSPNPNHRTTLILWKFKFRQQVSNSLSEKLFEYTNHFIYSKRVQDTNAATHINARQLFHQFFIAYKIFFVTFYRLKFIYVMVNRVDCRVDDFCSLCKNQII